MYDFLWQLGLFQVAEQSYLKKTLKGDIDFHLAEDTLSSPRVWLLYFVKSVIYHTILCLLALVASYKSNT